MIEGYSSETSAAPGDAVGLIHADSQVATSRLTCFRKWLGDALVHARPGLDIPKRNQATTGGQTRRKQTIFRTKSHEDG